MGFPGSSAVKNLPANAGDTGSIPGLGRSSGEWNGNPLQSSCLGNPMDRGTWQATVHGVSKSWTRLSTWTPTKDFLHSLGCPSTPRDYLQFYTCRSVLSPMCFHRWHSQSCLDTFHVIHLLFCSLYKPIEKVKSSNSIMVTTVWKLKNIHQFCYIMEQLMLNLCSVKCIYCSYFK